MVLTLNLRQLLHQAVVVEGLIHQQAEIQAVLGAVLTQLEQVVVAIFLLEVRLREMLAVEEPQRQEKIAGKVAVDLAVLVKYQQAMRWAVLVVQEHHLA